MKLHTTLANTSDGAVRGSPQRAWRLGALVATAILVVGACSGGAATTASPATSAAPASGAPTASAAASTATSADKTTYCPNGQVKAAVVGPMTGSEASYGQEQVNAVQLAAKEINAAGGISGGPLQGCTISIAGPYDDKADPATGAQIATQVASDPSILGYFGNIDSSVTSAALPILARANIAVLTAASSNPKLSTLGYQDFFRLVTNDNYEGGVIADVLVKTFKRQKIAVAWVNSSYGQGVAQAFKNEVAADGAQVAVDYGYPAGATDYSVFVTKAKQAGVDGIALLGTYTEDALKVKQLGAAGLTPSTSLTIMGNSSDNTPAFLTTAGAAAENVYLDGFWVPSAAGPAGQKFIADFKAAYNVDPSQNAALAFDAVEVWAYAVANGGSNRDALVTALHNVHGFAGVAGPIDFSATGERQNVQVTLLQVQSGKIATVPNP
ncbi:MAG TPA: branched-chain amino acid ABC transporter substrate-binding protein [Candidatus Saccharimonadales bacterium]|nr:branched-chain amino acid ABC transporter substrate-binding protein [Candidatus Saccharimonadales bacterium]